jgi:undecaprenyl-diphosphatase
MIPGRSLEEIDPVAVDDATLQATWVEVAGRHQAGIAHGDLGRHSVVVDDDGRPWLVDFDHTQTTREELGDAPGLWDELARRVAAPAAVPAADGDAGVRRRSSGPSR